jgi:hypothetical protein
VPPRSSRPAIFGSRQVLAASAEASPAFCLTTPSAFLVVLDGADAEPVVDHDLAAKDSSENKHPRRTCKDHVLEGVEFTLVLGELIRGKMANSAFSAIWSLHNFIAYSLFQLPRFLLS